MQCFDGAGALDGLGETVGDVGVGGVLAQVAGGCAAQVPAGDDHQRRHGQDTEEGERGAHQCQGAEGEDERDDGDERGGDAHPDRARQRVDVAG